MATKKKCTSGVIVGANQRVVIAPLTDNEMNVLGLNSCKLPGMTREMIVNDSFERDFAGQIAGGGKYGELSFSGNVIKGDKSQAELQKRLAVNEDFDDVWVFINKNTGDFWALNLAREECGKMNMASFDYQDTSKGDLVKVSVTMAIDGANCIFDIHTDKLLFDIAGGVLTATDGDFTAKGFVPDMSVIVETGKPTDPYFYATVKTVTATTLTFTDDAMTESALEGKIHGSSVVIPKV